MNGKTIWEIGRVFTNGTMEERHRLIQQHPDFIEKWKGRCRTIFKNVPERLKGSVPDEIAAAREISKFNKIAEGALIKCLEKDWINSGSSRHQVDTLYKKMGGVAASRHP